MPLQEANSLSTKFTGNHCLKRPSHHLCKLIITKRKVVRRHKFQLYLFQYHQASFNLTGVTKIKTLLKKNGETYTSAFNLYHNGNEGMSWHSDGEKDLKKKRHCFSKLWCRKNLPSNTKTARKLYQKF
jgi:hypothetical protein